MKKWKIAGINFDHMHMGDLLRLAFDHPCAEIVGICDELPDRMVSAAQQFKLSPEQVFTDYRVCLETTKPDLVILCPSTATHGEWTERVAPFGTHILMEKPFASNVAEADRMIDAMQNTGKQLVINWPLRWYPVHITTKRLVDEGVIGEVIEVHYYDGNRGPLYHLADKIEHEPTATEKASSWFYKRDQGGGSLLDYLGYGVTLGTWFYNGKRPIEVTTVTSQTAGLEVDEHSITIARYRNGLSKFETRWGTFTDPWTHQPQPKCGFVIKGTRGTISSYDCESTVGLQTAEHPAIRQIPVDVIQAPDQNPIQFVLNKIERGEKVDGPLAPEICRIGQEIVDAAARSAATNQTVKL
ncbi:MAG: Gfo/Idh/MocA family oxidoreductase [Luteolibacter sp.]